MLNKKDVIKSDKSTVKKDMLFMKKETGQSKEEYVKGNKICFVIINICYENAVTFYHNNFNSDIRVKLKVKTYNSKFKVKHNVI